MLVEVDVVVVTRLPLRHGRNPAPHSPSSAREAHNATSVCIQGPDVEYMHPSQLNCAVADVVGVVVSVVITVLVPVVVTVVAGMHCTNVNGHLESLNPEHKPSKITLLHGPAVPIVHISAGQLYTTSVVVVVVVANVVLVVSTAAPFRHCENPAPQTNSLLLLFT